MSKRSPLPVEGTDSSGVSGDLLDLHGEAFLAGSGGYDHRDDLSYFRFVMGLLLHICNNFRH